MNVGICVEGHTRTLQIQMHSFLPFGEHSHHKLRAAQYFEKEQKCNDSDGDGRLLLKLTRNINMCDDNSALFGKFSSLPKLSRNPLYCELKI
ncbi:hypothetical protein AVEN_220235-1 [Araneus ventricosus]|uniref:Uncharacterized protein n=1 Tax=Araneus ventricosus TaxID=182803 RepID=A0A4Y2HFF6_ARAVE|nr:hypothetical protein AVEN_220235-1 [Araneus ventricosus]